MERQERHRFVQQYVERQKAYLPLYTAENLSDQHHATPTRTCDGFGFDTPVLRPRVPARTVHAPHDTRPSKPRMHEPKSGPLTDDQAALPSPGKNNKQRSKRKEVAPADTDSERAARLANRRERKKKKRAIVNPPQKRDHDIATTTAPKKEVKGKNPTALALLYGFSATNVTKDRLTLKPPPSFGVFGKGKASAKQKVVTKTPRKETFSESAFLNKSNGGIADHSEIGNNSDDSSVSSISNQSIPQGSHTMKRTKKSRGKCTKTAASRSSRSSIRKTAGSEIWDIELQSKLPSSVRDISSEPEKKGPAPAVLDLRAKEWSASVHAAEEPERSRNETRKLSPTWSQLRGCTAIHSSLLPGLDLQESRVPEAAVVPSIHPSHSASQVGRHAVNMRPSDLRPVTSKYFAETDSVVIPVSPANAILPLSRSDDDINVLETQSPDRGVQDAMPDARTIHGAVSSINSLPNARQPMVEFQTWYEVTPLEFPSDNWRASTDMLWEHDCAEPCIVEAQGERLLSDCQGATWDWYRSRSPSVGLEAEYFQGTNYDPLAREYEYENEEVEEPGPGYFVEGHDGVYMGESGGYVDFAVSENEDICGSESEFFSEQGMRDGDVPGFLQGRALLLGVPEDEWRRVGLSGLVQAEMDVASRLRESHWRPLRL